MLIYDWNSLLESCFKDNGFLTPVQFASVHIKDTHDQWIVSVPTDNEEELLLCKDVAQRVISSVYKIILPSNVMDYQIEHGIIDSQMYHWPFLDSITDYTFTGKSPGRKCIDHEGTLEIFDLWKNVTSQWIPSGSSRENKGPPPSPEKLQ